VNTEPNQQAVIGAQQNNEIGISGVAPNCKLLPVYLEFFNTIPIPITTAQQYANGFNWARINGADVINNSWGLPVDCQFPILEEAVDSALIRGRNGKGTIVVFPSGNSNSAIAGYPQNIMPDILVVGAISPCGDRKSPSSCDGENWGSCYGAQLDIVVPGVFIPTTSADDTSGYAIYHMTSSACPHVAGVAALVLSANPNLTGKQVRDIIESTAQKVRPDLYGYADTTGRFNGTWHREMGYGLVNAHAAVLKALCYEELQGLPEVSGMITQNTTWDTEVHAVGRITVESGATLTITSTVKFNDESSIIVEPGSKLVIDGGTLTATCPNQLWKGIVVLGYSFQEQTAQYQGTVELKNGAVIEHAVCAINAAPAIYGNHSFIGGGGIIKADNAVFLNNSIAVNYSSYEYQSSPGVIEDNVGKFTNCTFIIDDDHRFATNQAIVRHHVTMWEVRGVTFEGCLFDNVCTNMPSPEEIGIYTLDAGFKIINHCAPAPAGPNIDCACPSSSTNIPTVFQNLTTGIRSDAASYPRPVYIDQSQFQNLTAGVRMNTQTNYRLTRCDFSNMSYSGLVSANSSGYRIEENDFFSTTGDGIGIFMNNSGSAENRIYKNSFSNLNKGISVSGVNASRTGLTGLQFICNDFEKNKYDIYISSNTTVHQNQGNSSTGANNRFVATGSSSIYSENLQAITYYHSPGSNQVPYNPIGNITIIGTAISNPCASTFCLPDGGKDNPKSDANSIEQYKAMQAQYDQLLALLDENQELLPELLILSDAMRELSDHTISRILQDSILYLEVLKLWYEVVHTPVAKYCLAEVYASERKYEQAEAILREIPTLFSSSELELIEHVNYMQFYNFKKEMILSGRNWTQLDEKEILQLQIIAETTEGRSSGMAKGVLCFFYDICYEDKIEKGGTPPKNATSFKSGVIADNTSLYELSVYPNPAQSEMMVVTGNSAIKIVQMEVYDLTGRKVHNQTLNQSSGTLRLNNLDKGIYILKVRLDQEDVVIRKVVKN